MLKIHHLFIAITFIIQPFNFTFSQKKEIAKVPKDLNEISGLVFLNDSVLVAHNDGGDEPILYFLNLKGEEIHRVKIEGAKNIDWEDIAFDGKEFLYIGDIGNNSNDRKDLCIYKVNSKGILKKDSVKSEKISLSYSEQKEFPENKPDRHFDAEGMAFVNDTIYIFTKCRTEPFDGKCYGYKVPTKAGNYKLEKQFELFLGKDGWFKDSATAVDIQDNKCYILTYNRLMIYTFENGKFVFSRHILLAPLSQIEAVAVNSKGEVFISDEEQKLLGGGKLYKISLKEKKKKHKKKHKHDKK